MSQTSIPSLYNQSFQSDEVFTTNFVARQQLLSTLCRRLKANGTENDGQHQILIGARGMGKTSLLRRLAIEINQEAELSLYFIPLVFREEQYNVLHLRDFWQNCGEALAEWADKNGNKELAARIDEALCSKAWNDDEGAAECFFAEMNALGKRAVLMVDNLDLILDALKEDDNWTLRGNLQSRGGPIIIGASTHTLSQTADRDAAFYEFFQPSYLEPLDLPETERCMRTLASGRDELGKKVISILNSDPARLKVLHRLSGGNPRVLALTYRFLETTDATDAMGDLERLLDEVTPYYKARIEEYQTPLQRATIDAIALHWDPVTTGQLTEITGVPNTTLSSQLNRLRKDGLIETVETSGSYSGYQITERFLNIWYLMRHGSRRNKQRMRWLVAFLSSFYSSKDLAAIALEAKANGSAEQWGKDYADAFAQAQQRAAYTSNKGFSQSINSTAAIGQKTNNITSNLKEAMAMLAKGLDFGQKGVTSAAITVYDALITRFVDSSEIALQALVASALVNKGIAIGQSGDTAAAIATFDTLITRFSDSPEFMLQEQVANAMFNKAIVLSQRGDAKAEIASYNELIARFIDSSRFALLEPVANAMVNKGATLGESGEMEEAITTFDTLIARFADTSELPIQVQIANAIFNKAIVLYQKGDTLAEIASYDELIARFTNSTELRLREPVANAMLNKAITLSLSGNTAAAITSFDELIAHFINSSEITLLEQVAKAMLNKGITMGQSADTVEAIAQFDALIARFDDSAELGLLEQVASAMFNKAIALNQRGDALAEIRSYDTLITRFINNSELVLLEHVANAMFYKAITLGQSGHMTEEITVYEQALTLLERLDTENAKQLKAEITIRLGNKLFDHDIDQKRSEDLFLQATSYHSLFAYANLFWVYLTTGRSEEAKQALSKIEMLPPQGLKLINSALAFESENFGEATKHLEVALSDNLTGENFDFTDDLERLLRFAITKGFGERLIAWFESTRFSERYAPIHIALLAAVRGERMLLDSNPEVRQTASEIYVRLIGSSSPKKGRNP